MADKILPINIEDEMKNSYIDYAMSVIVARALPDVRDGLKPVHRRILYSMNEMGLDPSKGYKKSARITGDTMGKYHPHGNSSIYDAMVRMAQDFSMRYMLVDGHGNFGSMDGDSAAAERYTEAKLSKISTLMLEDIEKETVEFVKNYDEELEEPSVLPAKYPNLLVNGSSGIAVGMATNIPPHNLREVIDAVVLMIDNRIHEERETDVEELMGVIKGPDFPTYGNILGMSGIKSAYRTGRGKVIIRGEAVIESNGNKDSIIISELPYQVNKARLVEKIADLVKDKRIEGIADLRDESDRHGVRIVVECKRDANSNVILNQLYKYSQLQESFGIIMLALVGGQPKVLNLYEMLFYYLEHQKDVLTKKTIFELKKAEARAHIIEGLLIALDNIDAVIKIIRESQNAQIAIAELIERFNLSEIQATAILNMQLRRLTGLERDKLHEEFNEIMDRINYLKSILNDDKVLYGVIREQLLEISNKFGDDRRSKFLVDTSEFNMEDLIDDEVSVITMTHLGYIKRLPLSTYRSQNRGGRGVMGMQTRDEDDVKSIQVCTAHETILMFTNKGKVYKLKAYEIPEAGRNARGTALVNLLSLEPDETVASIITLKEFNDDEYFFMVSKNGIVKKTLVSAYKNVRAKGIIALNILEDDALVNVMRANDNQNVFIGTKNGLGISFNVGSIRALSRKASGVRGIKLKDDDEVIGSLVLENDFKILLVSENGYGKCTEITEFRKQQRGGFGLKAYKITDKTGKVCAMELVNDNEELMILNSSGVIIRIRVSEISTLSRVTQGVKLINLGEDEKVIGINKITEEQVIEEMSQLEQTEEIEQEQNKEENNGETTEVITED